MVASNVTVVEEDGQSDSVVETHETYDGVQLTREEFEKTYKGCACCGDPLDFDDDGNDFLSSDAALCYLCSDELQRFQPDLYSQFQHGVMIQ